MHSAFLNWLGKEKPNQALRKGSEMRAVRRDPARGPQSPHGLEGYLRGQREPAHLYSLRWGAREGPGTPSSSSSIGATLACKAQDKRPEPGPEQKPWVRGSGGSLHKGKARPCWGTPAISGRTFSASLFRQPDVGHLPPAPISY